MKGLEACQRDPLFAPAMESLAQSLARAQGKLFPASLLPPESPVGTDMMRRATEYLAQALKVLQENTVESAAIGTAASSIAQALKNLHPVVEKARESRNKRSFPPPHENSKKSSTANVNVDTMLNMNTDHQFYNGFSENIEEGGIFVATFDPKPLEAKVIVNFKLPGGRPVTARGIVHFVREYNPINPGMAPGMGVKFTDLMPGDKEAIEEYLTERAPMFYDDGD